MLSKTIIGYRKWKILFIIKLYYIFIIIIEKRKHKNQIDCIKEKSPRFYRRGEKVASDLL